MTAAQHDNGLDAAVSARAPADSYEVEREAVIAMLERERRSLTSSLIALALMAVGIAFLPNPALLALLLALRAASFLFTRTAATRLEQLVRQRRPLARARGVLFGAMTLTGITLALMLWPPGAGAPIAAVTMIRVVVLVAVTLISVTLAALPASRDAMLMSFLLTCSAIVLFHPLQIDFWLIPVAVAFVSGVRIYSANTGAHIRSAAQVLVENRQLSEELVEALAHAEFLSWRDPLTGLFNRRRLFEETRLAGETSDRYLFTIDLDRFKAINDSFGHAVGDHVLIAAADAIRAWCDTLGEGEHCAFRMGGEEFLVIAMGLESGAIEEAAERLRADLHALEASFTHCPMITISASIGTTRWRSREAIDEALLRADLACYEAKEAGRNMVRHAR